MARVGREREFRRSKAVLGILARQELADELRINYQTVGYLERGEYSPSLGPAFQIAEYFELPIEAIFSRTPFGPMSTELYRRSA